MGDKEEREKETYDGQGGLSPRKEDSRTCGEGAPIFWVLEGGGARRERRPCLPEPPASLEVLKRFERVNHRGKGGYSFTRTGEGRRAFPVGRSLLHTRRAKRRGSSASMSV